MRPVLLELAAEPNVRLWWSVDRDSGPAPLHDNIAGQAYLAENDQDQPDFPVDLIFRNLEESEMKFTPDGYFVCPYEQGVRRKVRLTCSRCRFCFNPRSLTATPRPTGGRRISLSLV
jgi:hypothetical protein